MGCLLLGQGCREHRDDKSGISSCVADRMGPSKSTTEGTVDTMLGAISEALAREETVRVAGFGNVPDEKPGCPYWP